ncbi:hypothetical protein A0H76_1017 [Hepatospora eriocheir]|uniref:Uncharacterized protein n=1 Tax=Hepatospora eriocheir TaxID=1081669 RepID=A0A1X0QI48_9MICR|nr:hypothetical protein A0H76_1017 [Hepatospora eriocheir]
MNLKEYFVKQPIEAKDEKVVWEHQRNEVRDILIDKEQLNLEKEMNFEGYIMSSQTPLLIFKRTFNLLDSHVLSTLKINKEENLNISVDLGDFIKDELINIIDNNLKKIEKMIEEENEFYKKILRIKQNIYISDKALYVKVSKGNYVEYKDEDIECKTFKCTIQVNDLKLVGTLPTDNLTYFDKLKFNQMSEKIVGDFNLKDINIKIEYVNQDDIDNPLIRVYLKELLNETKRNIINRKLILGLSIYHLKSITRNFYVVKFNDVLLEDGLPQKFYAIDGDNTYKIIRFDTFYSISKNGKKII